MPDTDFEPFFSERIAAAEAYVNGDAARLDALLAKHGGASFHNPRGGSVVGAEAVASRYRDDARVFKGTGKSRFEVIQKGSEWRSGLLDRLADRDSQFIRARYSGKMRIRVTEVFRRILELGGSFIATPILRRNSSSVEFRKLLNSNRTRLCDAMGLP